MNIEKFRKEFDALIDAQGEINGEDFFEELFYYATVNILRNCPCNFVAMRIIHESIVVALEEYKRHLVECKPKE